MKTSRKTAGVTLVVTVLIVMLLLASVVVVTGQLALSARRSSADQDATIRAQYVAESGLARARAQMRGLGTLLSPGAFQPAVTVTSSQMVGFVLPMCNLTALPTFSTYPVTLCGIDPTQAGAVVNASTPNVFSSVPVSDNRVSLFTNFLADAQLQSIGYNVSATNTKAQYFNNLFQGTGANLAGAVGGSAAAVGTVTGNVTAKIIGVTMSATDVYKVYLQVPDVNTTGTLANGSSRVLKISSDQKIYVMTVGRSNFAKFGLFTNHHFTGQAAEASNNPIYFTQNTNYSGPVHTNQNAVFGLSSTTAATSPSANGSTFAGGFGSAGCPAGQIVSTPTGELDPNTGLALSVDSCNTSAALQDGALFNGYYYSAADMNDQGNGSTSLLPNVDGVQPTFGGNPPNWNDQFIALPPNGTSQTQAAQHGGLYLSGTVKAMTLAVNPSLNLGGVLVKAQTITYTQGGTTTQLAYGADGRMFIKVGGTWLPAAQVPCTPSATIIGPPTVRACSISGGSWAATTGPQGLFSGVVYAQNSIGNLNGPLRTTQSNPATAAPAVADFAQITLASDGDINITSDLKYESPPCTGTTVTTPNCTNTSTKNILGIYSAQGDVVIKSPRNDGGGTNSPATPPNVTIQAVLMASGGPIAGSNVRNGRIRVDGYAYGSGMGNVNLLGGMIENYYGVFGQVNGTGYGRNIIYDVRTNDGVAPPSFPTQQNWGVTMQTAPIAGAAAADVTLGLSGSVIQGKN